MNNKKLLKKLKEAGDDKVTLLCLDILSGALIPFSIKEEEIFYLNDLIEDEEKALKIKQLNDYYNDLNTKINLYTSTNTESKDRSTKINEIIKIQESEFYNKIKILDYGLGEILELIEKYNIVLEEGSDISNLIMEKVTSLNEVSILYREANMSSIDDKLYTKAKTMVENLDDAIMLDNICEYYTSDNETKKIVLSYLNSFKVLNENRDLFYTELQDVYEAKIKKYAKSFNNKFILLNRYLTEENFNDTFKSAKTFSNYIDLLKEARENIFYDFYKNSYDSIVIEAIKKAKTKKEKNLVLYYSEGNEGEDIIIDYIVKGLKTKESCFEILEEHSINEHKPDNKKSNLNLRLKVFEKLLSFDNSKEYFKRLINQYSTLDETALLYATIMKSDLPLKEKEELFLYTNNDKFSTIEVEKLIEMSSGNYDKKIIILKAIFNCYWYNYHTDIDKSFFEDIKKSAVTFDGIFALIVALEDEYKDFYTEQIDRIIKLEKSNLESIKLAKYLAIKDYEDKTNLYSESEKVIDFAIDLETSVDVFIAQKDEKLSKQALEKIFTFVSSKDSFDYVVDNIDSLFSERFKVHSNLYSTLYEQFKM